MVPPDCHDVSSSLLPGQSDEADLFDEEHGGPDVTFEEEMLEELAEEEEKGLTITKEHATSKYLGARVHVLNEARSRDQV